MKQKQIVLPLTKAQNDYLQPIVNEVGRLRDQIGSFLRYVAAEAGLPQPEKDWDLKIDKNGQTASLVGTVAVEEDLKGKEN